MGMLVDGKWTDDDGIRNDKGKFVRPDSICRNWVTKDGAPGPSGSAGFEAEPGRYHLYVSHNCPWAYRTVLFRKLKGLEDLISMAISASSVKGEGWTYVEEEGCVPDSVNQIKYLHEAYTKSDPHYTGRVTVPTLWDKKQNIIVSNESSEIIRMFNSEFNHLTGNEDDYYHEDLREEIDTINDDVYGNLNNGVYRCGFAASQEAYEEAYEKLFVCLDRMEERLSKQRYLVGGRLTESDWRLFSTLVRFDIVYYGLFKCNKRHVYEYPNLWDYTLELYQYPGVAEVSRLDHFKRGYYAAMPKLNPLAIVPVGPDLDFTQSHDRNRFPIA